MFLALWLNTKTIHCCTSLEAEKAPLPFVVTRLLVTFQRWSALCSVYFNLRKVSLKGEGGSRGAAETETNKSGRQAVGRRDGEPGRKTTKSERGKIGGEGGEKMEWRKRETSMAIQGLCHSSLIPTDGNMQQEHLLVAATQPCLCCSSVAAAAPLLTPLFVLPLCCCCCLCCSS